MKKLLSVILSTALIVCMMPSMVFATDNPKTKTWEENGKFKVELKSEKTQGTGTTATAIVYDDYSVDAKVTGTKVYAGNVSATVAMKNVASLGVTDERSHSITVNTGLTQEPDLRGWFDNLYNFKGATVNGKVDGNKFKYSISAFDKTEETNTHVCTATPSGNVREAWHALADKVTATTTTDNSKIIVKKGTTIQIGSEKLTFDSDCTVDPSSQNGGANTESAIRDAASLKTDATPAKTNIEMYLPKGSVLQVGGSIATLNKSLYIRSDLELSEKTPLATLRNASGIYNMLYALVTLSDKVIGDINSKTVQVDILSECMVKVGDADAVSYAYGDIVTLPSEAGKVWKNQNGEPVSGEVIITEDMTFTKENVFVPTTPSTPVEKDPVTNTGDAGTDNATTNADITDKVTTSDGKTEAVVDQVIADKIVDKAVENKSTEVVVEATTAAGKSDASQVALPESTVKAIAEQTDAAITIKTDNAEVTLDKEAVSAVAGQAGTTGTVKLVVETVENTAEKVVVELKLKTSNGYVSDFKGGNVTVTVPVAKDMADKKVVCVYIDDNGIYTKVEGQLNSDGTYTFKTGHFSTYAIMSEEEADAVIAKQTAAAQKAAIKDVKTTVTLSTKNVKKGIKVTVKVPVDQKADKTGIILYRSMKKGSGYAMYKKVETKSSTYIITNTKNVKGNRLTAGKRYYYKARAYKVIDGKTYYGPMSTVKYKKAK